MGANVLGMFSRRLIPILAVTLFIAPSARATTPVDEVVVAIIDTGIRPTHQEFDYRGPESQDDQIVAWWDFTNEDILPSVPEPGVRWDPRNAIPYDDDGHGTATAAMAVGRNVAAAQVKAPSFAPGAKLAVARACDATNACFHDRVANAILWATNTVEADIISISASAQLPTGNLQTRVHEAARVARRNGALVIVANGNGLFSSAVVPEPGLLMAFGDSPAVLGVGGDGDVFEYGLTTDPELVAAFQNIPIAARTCDSCHAVATGTSLSAPLVAGMAATALKTARANGHDLDPDGLEVLLKFSARDTETPPPFEGYGVLDAQALETVLAHAAAGTLPPRPDPDPNALYVDTVTRGLRDLSTNGVDGGTKAFVPLGRDPANGQGVIEYGLPTGVAEIERYTLHAPEGAHVVARYTDLVPDTDLFLTMYAFEGDGDRVLSWNDMVAWNRNAATVTPWIDMRSTGEPMTLVIVYEFAFPRFNPATFNLHIGGADVTYDGDDLALASTTFIVS